jgi:hypothetical protein
VAALTEELRQLEAETFEIYDVAGVELALSENPGESCSCSCWCACSMPCSCSTSCGA